MLKRSNTLTVWTWDEVRKRCTVGGPEDECLIWNGGVNSGGIPTASVNGKSVNLRRYIFTALMGRPDPGDRVIRPRCANPRCLSEHCLQSRTRSDALRLAAERRFESNPMLLRHYQRMPGQLGIGKLSPEKAAEIRVDPRPSMEIASELGVHPETVRSIRRGATWRALPANSVFSLGG